MTKILIWDLETSGMNSFHADLASIVCFGYKWLGDRHTYCLRISDYPGWFTDHQLNDRPLLVAALSIMEEADLLVAHFGDKFDRRMFQGRCVIQGLTPPPPVKQRDTWRIAKTAFNFNSNRLGNLAVTLGCRQKKTHKNSRDRWPGWWHRTMGGDASAVAEMAEYCKQDVRTLEEVYIKIRVYDNPHPRVSTNPNRCRLCGSTVQYRGVALAAEHRYRRFKCTKCGKWDRETKALK